MYYKLPKKLFSDDKYKFLSMYSIVLYCILKDRVSLSEITGRYDENGQYYIFFSRQEMAELLRVSERSAVRYIKELVDARLISFGSKEGCTSPPIYVKDILQTKKPVQLNEQANSYDNDVVHKALLEQFMEL